LLVIDLFIAPDSTPVAFSPTIGGLGGTWARQDSAGDMYETVQRWRCEIGSGSVDTVDVSWAASATVLYSLIEITGHVSGSNGANAFVQTNRSASGSVSLGAFASVTNQALASWGNYHSSPGGTVDSPMVIVGSMAELNTGAEWRLASGSGQNDIDPSITWSGSWVARSIASEIAVA
jgi:hypothetical protein